MLAAATILLGCLHVLLTERTTGSWVTLGSVYFIGCGLSIVFLGLVNVILLRTSERGVRRMGHAANAAGVALFGLGAWVAPLPQIVLLLALTLALSVLGVVTR
jgi:hypothetical protein